MKHALLYRKGMFCFLMFFILIQTGCLTTSPKDESKALFFPPEPELPRLQYLTTIHSSADVLPPKSSFDKFVTGGSRSISLDKPYGIAVRDGKVYVCDTNATVFIFDYKNQKFYPLKGAKGRGSLVEPLNISIAADGHKYVADTVRGQVLAYDEKDFFVKAYGKKGDGKPIDAVPLDEYLYVADIKNRAVKVYEISTGKLKRTIGNTGEQGELLEMPLNLAFDSNKILYVVDASRFEIVKYDRDGHFLGTISGHGKSVGALARPRGIAIDNENRIYVVDAAFNNVQIFHESGQVLLPFGYGGRRKGALYLPAGITIDYDAPQYFTEYIDPDFNVEYLVFVTNQFEINSVNVFGFGKKKEAEYVPFEELVEKAKEDLLANEEEAAETSAD